MKNSKDIMHVRERYNKKGELSFILYCSGKDAFTKKYKLHAKTYKVPNNLKGKKEIEKFRINCQLEFKEEVDKKSKGILANEGKKIYFYDYAEKWVEDILRYNNDAYNHYSHCKLHLKIFKEKFGLYTLDEMTLPVIQNFCDWLCERTYKKEIIIVKKDIRQAMKEKKVSFKQTWQECGISNATLCTALKVGNRISKDTAKKICNYLNINFNSYFEMKSEEVPYSRCANKSLKTMLHSILARAVQERLIPINYATKEYTKSVTGTKGKKEIYDTIEDIREFVAKANEEKDIRKKVAFLIGLNLGLRGAEIAGLEWKDINFENEIISINKNTMYVNGFGIITKTTKNNSSTRIIRLPSNLVSLLKDYKVWWDEEKAKHGDLWENTDRLFVQNCGKDMCNATISNWLKKFEIENNLKHVTLHGLRHTNITMQITNGVDIKTVSARVGHSDTQTTLNIYSHYTKESDKKASELIDKIICG